MFNTTSQKSLPLFDGKQDYIQKERLLLHPLKSNWKEFVVSKQWNNNEKHQLDKQLTIQRNSLTARGRPGEQYPIQEKPLVQPPLRSQTMCLSKGAVHSPLTLKEPFVISPCDMDLIFKQWKKIRPLQEGQKVFIVCNTVGHILRPLLLNRGWYENLDPESFCFDLKWTASRQFKLNLRPILSYQIINHFRCTECFTRKDYLYRTLLTESHFVSPLPISRFLPSTATCNGPDDMTCIIDCVLMGQALAIIKLFILRQWLRSPGNLEIWLPGQDLPVSVCHHVQQTFHDHLPRQAVATAISILLKKLLFLENTSTNGNISKQERDDLESAKIDDIINCVTLHCGSLPTNCIHIVEDVLQELKGVSFLKSLESLLSTLPLDRSQLLSIIRTLKDTTIQYAHQSNDSSQPICNSTEEILIADTYQDDATNMITKAGIVLECIYRQNRFAFDADGWSNVWILKPSTLSRGRDIELHRDIHTILKGIERPLRITRDGVVCQKYIEHPFIINNRKFDIRQWVLVTSWSPLRVWFYKEAYCRFAVEEFHLSNLTDKYQHLTNNAISKQSSKFHSTGIPGNMWSTLQLKMYLENKCKHLKDFHLRFGNDPWNSMIYPRMKQIAATVCMASANTMTTGCSNGILHELFGFDFLVDQNLNVWLLEVNACPDLSSSTPTTKTLVAQCLEDTLRVILDWTSAPLKQRSSTNTGNFELLIDSSTDNIKGPSTLLLKKTLVVNGTSIIKPQQGDKCTSTNRKKIMF